MNDILNNFTSLVRKGVDEYGMIADGDDVAVGISGGKDSLLLLCALHHLQRYYPKRFTLRAVTVELGFPDMDFTPVAELCRRLGVPYTRVRTDIREIVFDVRQEKNPCALCAAMRRGALNNAIRAAGSSVLALGHHRDDAVETFFMGLLLEGRLNCFKPVTWMSRAEVRQIRPMICCTEAQIAAAAEALQLPVVRNTCPMDVTSRRHEMKELIASLEQSYPGLRSKVFGAMRRYPLEGWAPAVWNRKKGDNDGK